MNLVMFDIDGTLTASDVMDGECFVEAVRDVFGFTEVSTDWAAYRHCSDSGILEELFQERVGRSPHPGEIAEVQTRFTDLLETAMAAKPVEPIPGAREMLLRLLSERDTAVSLASGAWECSARAKLRKAGLDLAGIPGAFADDAQARVRIMRTSLKRAAEQWACQEFSTVVYVGDGVWDVQASRDLGCGFVGVGREPARRRQLMDLGARSVFPDFTGMEEFRAALREQAAGAARDRA